MNVIISSELDNNYDNYVVVDSFKRASEVKGISNLIIHRYKETDFDVGIYMSNFHSTGIRNFFYITSSPSAMMSMVLKGVGGIYIEDEFYFESEEDLNALLEELSGESTTTESTDLATSSINILDEFIQAFVRGEEKIKAPVYIERVNNAITELSELTHQQEIQLTTMGNSAIEVFEKASNIIKSMDEQRKLIEKKVDELELASANATSSKPSFGNNVIYFAPYKYMGNAKVLVIREYSPCRYLTSFALGYENHLHYELNKRCKLIFVHQKGQGVYAKYAGFAVSITQESYTMSSLYDNEIINTNNPKKEVLKELLMKHLDVIVVVDRLYNKDDIVTGRVVKVNAASGKGDLAKYNLDANNTIFSVKAQQEQLFSLPTIKDYPTEKDSRIAYYTQVMSQNYMILDRKLGL